MLAVVPELSAEDSSRRHSGLGLDMDAETRMELPQKLQTLPAPLVQQVVAGPGRLVAAPPGSKKPTDWRKVS